MRRIIILLLLAISFSTAIAQRQQESYLTYIAQYKDLAIEQMLKYHIPASITLSQGLLESRAGLSKLASQGNNHFGIKCHGWRGRSMSLDDDDIGECFRVYDNVRESFEDHSRFLQQPRYKRLFSLSKTDYRGWARGLKACGYATNPRYADNLINIIELYRLDKFDHARSYDHFIASHSGSDKLVGGEQLLHPIHICNKNYYLVAREGDTFKSIGKEVGISWRKIAKYNERDRHETLHKGDIVFLKKKRRKADKAFKNRPHIVKAGESMYDIAQLYGVRLKSLYYKNNFSPTYKISVGEKIRVY